MLSNQMYNMLKYTVTTVLPALGTLYFAIAQIWGAPFGEQVVGTLTALALFGGGFGFFEGIWGFRGCCLM